MKSYSPKEIIKILEKNGWKLKNIKGDHYIYKKQGMPYEIVIPFSRKDVRIGIMKDIERKSGIKFK